MEEKKSSFAKASAFDKSSADKSEGKEELNIEELKKQVEECKKLKDEYLAGWQRARADLLNYKKEEMERIGDILKYAGEGLILKMLSILDNFEIVEKKLPEDLKNNESVKGILQIKNQILDFFKSQGVEEIKSVGDKFDPNFHEAVEDVPSEASAKEEVESSSAKATEDKEKESGIIFEEIQKGYKINGRLLRPAKVRITK